MELMILFKQIPSFSYDSNKGERFLSHGADRAERDVLYFTRSITYATRTS